MSTWHEDYWGEDLKPVRISPPADYFDEGREALPMPEFRTRHRYSLWLPLAVVIPAVAGMILLWVLVR